MIGSEYGVAQDYERHLGAEISAGDVDDAQAERRDDVDSFSDWLYGEVMGCKPARLQLTHMRPTMFDEQRQSTARLLRVLIEPGISPLVQDMARGEILERYYRASDRLIDERAAQIAQDRQEHQE